MDDFKLSCRVKEAEIDVQRYSRGVSPKDYARIWG